MEDPGDGLLAHTSAWKRTIQIWKKKWNILLRDTIFTSPLLTLSSWNTMMSLDETFLVDSKWLRKKDNSQCYFPEILSADDSYVIRNP